MITYTYQNTKQRWNLLSNLRNALLHNIKTKVNIQLLFETLNFTASINLIATVFLD